MSRLRELIDELCPDGVEYRTLGEVAPFVRERANTGEAQFDAYVGVDALLQNKMGRDLAKTDIPDGRHIYFRPGDTLLGNIRPYLKKVWFADCPGGTNGDVLVFRAKADVDPKYLFYVISSDDFFIYDNGKAKGSKMPRGDKEAIRKYRLPVPPIEVQREIVRILDSFQELDEALAAEIEAREKQHAEIRDSFLLGDASVPKRPFREFCESMNTGPFGSSVHKSDYVDDGCPIVNPADIVGTKIAVGKKVSPEAESRLLRYKLQKDDIVIGRRGEMGRIGLVDENSEGYLCGTGCFFVRMNDKALPGYWAHFFGTSYAKTYLDAHAVGGTMKNLNLNILGNMPVPVPDWGRRNAVVSQLDTLREFIRQLETERDTRRTQFEYYRDKLLSFPEKEA